LAKARASLEREILSELIPSKITEKDCERLVKNIDMAGAQFLKNENSERLRTNFGFHTMLAGITDNPIVILMHKVIVDLSIEFFENVEASVPMVKKTLDQHRKIVDLLKQSKFEEAGKICFQHIVDVSSTIIEKSKQQSLIISRRI